MNKLVCGAATILIFLIMIVHKGGAILCWDCNSAHDPRCGEHSFSDRTVGYVDCDQLERVHLKDQKARYCRKIIQKIGETTRTIRGCGWLEDKKAHGGRCYTRTGTKDVMVTFCQCEGDKCNTASSLFRGSTLALVTVPLFTLVKLF